jgi:hypothetical protein
LEGQSHFGTEDLVAVNKIPPRSEIRRRWIAGGLRTVSRRAETGFPCRLEGVPKSYSSSIIIFHFLAIAFPLLCASPVCDRGTSFPAFSGGAPAENVYPHLFRFCRTRRGCCFPEGEVFMDAFITFEHIFNSTSNGVIATDAYREVQRRTYQAQSAGAERPGHRRGKRNHAPSAEGGIQTIQTRGLQHYPARGVGDRQGASGKVHPPQQLSFAYSYMFCHPTGLEKIKGGQSCYSNF